MLKLDWKQLELPMFGQVAKEPDNTEIESHIQRIAGHLSIRLPEPVDVVFNDNRTTMVSFKRKSGRLQVRLHRLFRHADPRILDALALYLGKRDRASSKILDEFITSLRNEIRPAARRRRLARRPKGCHHDLTEVLARVNRTYFEDKIDVDITWGRAPAKRRRRRTKTVSRALATYSYDDCTIRVSPVLDSPSVPEYVLDWVVYHEMLHHVLPVEETGDKRRYHTRRFKTLERAFLKYEEAKSWEKSHLDQLLS